MVIQNYLGPEYITETQALIQKPESQKDGSGLNVHSSLWQNLNGELATEHYRVQIVWAVTA